MKFQYYPAQVKSNTPIGFVSLDEFIRAHKKPRPETIKIFEQIAKAEAENNQELKAELKQNNLYYFTPCITIIKYRRYSDISTFNGIAVLDFDHIDNAEELKEYIFNEYKFIIAAWLSPSKRGVKALLKIPIVKTIEDFRDYYRAIEKTFEIYDGWDGTNKNAVLPLFQSYDPNLLQRDNAKTFKDRIKEQQSDPVKKYTVKYSGSDNKERLILKMAETGIIRISAPGHPQLRSICRALGGYVAAGYINKTILLSHVDRLIESNSYLCKGTKGYKKTARWAIDAGAKKPIYLV